MKIREFSEAFLIILLITVGSRGQEPAKDPKAGSDTPEVTSDDFKSPPEATKPSATASSPPKDDTNNGDTSMRALSDLAGDINQPAATIVQNGDQSNPDGTDTELPPSDVRDITSSVQSANLERPVAPEATSAAPMGNSSTNGVQLRCDQRTHKGCDVINYERCTQVGSCECLRGYLKDGVSGKCIAAQFFRGQIELANEYTEDLADTSSAAYDKLTSQLQQVLRKAFNNQEGILAITITDVAQDKILVTFEVAVDKVTSGGRDGLQHVYNQGLAETTLWDETEGVARLRNTDLILGNNNSTGSYIRNILEYNHCVDAEHNYCDVNAVCTHSMRSFTCKCRDGYDDVSPDKPRSPGEHCVVKCKCRNNGTCEAVNGVVQCRCPQWFIGSNCEINGKDLLIICCSVLGGLLVLTLLLCLVCVCAVKNKSRKSSRSSTVGVGSLDTSVVKLPRVWMDGSRPYELPPRDMRRWSYVSEPIRYVDEYMMDDYVHAETLPLPRSHDAKKRFYPAYGNQAYSSSTLNIRPSSRY